ncbi:MAG: histidine phosphatase family protein [Gammaproteobacteria bacterium]
MLPKHTLILLRHGKSDWSAEVDDFHRPLNKRGEKSVPKVGKWLKDHGPLPDRIISSPAERAWRTARLMARALGLEESEIIREQRVYESGLEDLVAVIDSYCGDTDCLMIVGHNPGLDELLMHLSATPPPRNETGKLMTTGAMAILDYASQPISSGAGSAELKELKRPKEL